jgi:ribosomal protein S12 methylthiotransferase accessory factor YcaO
MFTLRGMKMVVALDSMCPNGDDLATLVPITEYYQMTDQEIADANLEMIRNERDALLAETDWVSGEDVPQGIKDTYFPYRQALRDITDTYTVYADVVWPTKPE